MNGYYTMGNIQLPKKQKHENKNPDAEVVLNQWLLIVTEQSECEWSNDEKQVISYLRGWVTMVSKQQMADCRFGIEFKKA
jgi:hypothetical protein